jgi:multidrug resistance efflux pump
MNNIDSARPALSDRVRSLRLGGREDDRGSRSRFLPWMVSFVLLLTTVAFGYRAYRVSRLPEGELITAQSKENDRSAATSPLVTVTSSVAATGEVVLQAKGYVIPVSLVQVSPKVGGQLIKINERFAEGNKFNKDDILAVIEKVEYESEYRQAQFAFKAATERYEELVRTMPEETRQAEAELEEAKSTVAQLRLEYERNRRLVMSSALAQRDLEQAKYAYEANTSRVKRLEATVRLIKEGRQERRIRAARFEMEQAEALLKRAEWRYNNTEIRAPITGTILTKKAELGNIVNPSAFSSGISASLCEMADLTRLEIDLSVQERDLATVKERQPCWIMPEAYKADKQFLAKHPQGYKGEVSRKMPTADRAKGAVPVRVKVLEGEIPETEAGKYLQPDLSATVSFLRVEEKPSPSKTRPVEKK